MKKLISTACFLLVLGNACGQELLMSTLSSGGNHESDQNTQLSWNLGESCIHTWSEAGFIITEGFFQDYDLLLDNGPNPAMTEVYIYPNPAANFLYLRNRAIGTESLQAVLFDLNGHLIFKKMINTDPCRIDLTGLSNGTYFLRITDGQTRLHALHKIIKSKNN